VPTPGTERVHRGLLPYQGMPPWSSRGMVVVVISDFVFTPVPGTSGVKVGMQVVA